jgi:drug/metabolite transporter (DMT)-like permease
MNSISLGQYYPANSLIHKLDPRIKVIIAILYVVCTFLCKNVLSFALLLVSIFLLKKPSDGKKFSKSWLTYVAISFGCNGISSIVQKLHQTAYPGEFQGEFMIFSMFVSLLLFVFVWAVVKKDSGDGVCHAKYALPAGVLMGFNNFLTLSLASKFNASVLFPTVSVFQTVFNLLFSKLFFKEKVNIRQIIGILVGVASVILIK